MSLDAMRGLDFFDISSMTAACPAGRSAGIIDSWKQ